jgi:hypothetical protein
MIKKSKLLYSDEWRETSDEYSILGIYDWCVRQICDSSNVLEIGSGTGNSTIKILESGKNVTSIESNEYNFLLTKKRILLSNLNSSFFDSDVFNFTNLTENNLILSDYIDTPKIFQELVGYKKFNAIICWLLGVHSAAHLEEHLQKRGYVKRSPEDYRDMVYNTIFQFSAEKLRTDSIISIIERNSWQEGNAELISEHIKTFSEYYELEKYNLKVDSVNELEIEGMNKIAGIKLEKYGNIHLSGDNLKHGLISLKIKKRQLNN